MINKISVHLKNVTRLAICASLSITLLVSNTTYALNSFYGDNDILFYDADGGSTCTSSNTSIPSIGTDYKGQEILTSAQKTAIQENQSVYEEAANEVDIPWQLIAVVHLRETSLGRTNPSNGQGIYQFVNGNGGPYPTGPVDDAEFLRQTKLAAQFLKNKAKDANLDSNTNLTKNSDANTIKDTFFSYNGRAEKYADQAASLGYDKATEPYEGSPYVMNIADKQRDPAVNTTSWGQIKRDNGPIEYPANGQYGAYVIYASIAGIQATNCGGSTISGTVREKVVTLANKELALWDSETLTGNGSDFKKYTNGGSDNWCAWFASWIYNQAGYPIDTAANNGAVPAVNTIKAIGEKGDRFEYHDKAGYTPQVGDITVYKNNGASHVNIVVAVASDGKITIVGGNQGYSGSGQAATSYLNSRVTSYSLHVSDDPDISGFVSPKG